MIEDPTPEDIIDLEARNYYTNAGFATSVFPTLVARDPYLNGLVAQLEDVNAAILRRIKQLVTPQ